MWSVTSRIWPILAWLVRAFGGDRLAAGLLLARTFMGGPKPESRIHTTTNTDSASLSLKGGTMSVTMSKTFTSPDFLTKFLEEYREMPVLWQVRSADYSNRTKRDEAWDLLM